MKTTNDERPEQQTPPTKTTAQNAAEYRARRAAEAAKRKQEPGPHK